MQVIDAFTSNSIKVAITKSCLPCILYFQDLTCILQMKYTHAIFKSI